MARNLLHRPVSRTQPYTQLALRAANDLTYVDVLQSNAEPTSLASRMSLKLPNNLAESFRIPILVQINGTSLPCNTECVFYLYKANRIIRLFRRRTSTWPVAKRFSRNSTKCSVSPAAARPSCLLGTLYRREDGLLQTSTTSI